MNYSDIIKKIEDSYNIITPGGGRSGFSGKECHCKTQINNKWYCVVLIYVYNEVKVKSIILENLKIRKEKLKNLNNVNDMS